MSMKWVYIEDHVGNLLLKVQCDPKKVFNLLKTTRPIKVVSVVQESEHSVVYRVYLR